MHKTGGVGVDLHKVGFGYIYIYKVEWGLGYTGQGGVDIHREGRERDIQEAAAEVHSTGLAQRYI